MGPSEDLLLLQTATRADHSGKLNSKQDLYDLHEREINFHWGLVL
jgi:hypothetical protein